MSDITYVGPVTKQVHGLQPMSSDDCMERNPHVFEIHVASDTIYYVGDDPSQGGSEECLSSAESGVGLDQARCMESAIHQAMLPLTPQPSVEAEKGRLAFNISRLSVLCCLFIVVLGHLIFKMQ